MELDALKALSSGLDPDVDGRSRLAAAAVSDSALAAGVLDVALGDVDTPLGPLLIAVTPRGLARVAFEFEGREAVVERLAARLSPRILRSARATDAWRRQLDGYFAGSLIRFDLPVDRRLIGGIAREVLAATARVRFGRTTTYGAIAERIGRPRAARAVGNALGSNPIPIVIPCHRVLRSGGSLGGYAGGVERKRRLLTLEAGPIGV
jgi:methylated-DNA-[protein]-cysteine S-methyltransferase